LSKPRIYPPLPHGQRSNVQITPGVLDEEFASASEERSFGEDFDALASGHTARPGSRPSGQRKAEDDEELLALRREAEETLARAREAFAEAEAEAQGILDKVRSQADSVEAAAYQAGFAQGEEAGKRLADQKVASVVRQLKSVADEMVGQQAQMLHDGEEKMVKLALLIALKIVHREVTQSPEVIFDVVRAGMDRLKRASRLTICVSPQDFRFIEEHIEDFRAMAQTGTEMNIEPDEEVGRGGCRIRSNTGEVDATIGSAVKKLMESIWSGEELVDEE